MVYDMLPTISLYHYSEQGGKKKKGMQWLKGADWVSVNPSMAMGQ
jgi:hypothetical protein